MRLLIVVLLLFPLSLLADMPSMKRDNFELVFAASDVGEECPVTKDDVNGFWEAEMLRARLKRQFYGGEDGWLWIKLSCVQMGSNDERIVYHAQSSWTWKDPSGDWVNSNRYNNMGIVGEQALVASVKEIIEATITQYLKENLE